jgi:patatin-like phospholipase/acyl hydrolase
MIRQRYLVCPKEPRSGATRSAAPTFLKPHMTESAVELVDGGVWANNPIGVAAVEAIGMLGWPGDRLKILSIGTINEPGRLPRLRGRAVQRSLLNLMEKMDLRPPSAAA